MGSLWSWQVTLHEALTWALEPLDRTDPFYGLLAASFACSLITIAGYLLVSNQTGLARAREQIIAGFLSLILYPSSLRHLHQSIFVSSRAFRDYLWHSGKPILILAPILTFLFGHLETRYRVRPLQEGEQFLVWAELETESQAWTIAPESGFGIEVGPLHEAESNQVIWRLVASPHASEILVLQNTETGQSVTKRVAMEPSLSPIHKRGAETVDRLLLEPGEEPLDPSSGIRSITIQYPAREFFWGNQIIPWWALFGGMTLLLAFALAITFRVQL